MQEAAASRRTGSASAGAGAGSEGSSGSAEGGAGGSGSGEAPGSGAGPRACPSCGTGRLGLKLSNKTGGFIGCSNYPECTYLRPLWPEAEAPGDEEWEEEEEGQEGSAGGAAGAMAGPPGSGLSAYQEARKRAEALGVKGGCLLKSRGFFSSDSLPASPPPCTAPHRLPCPALPRPALSQRKECAAPALLPSFSCFLEAGTHCPPALPRPASTALSCPTTPALPCHALPSRPALHSPAPPCLPRPAPPCPGAGSTLHLGVDEATGMHIFARQVLPSRYYLVDTNIGTT